MVRDPRIRRRAAANDVGQMDESAALEADVDKRGLHARHHAQDPADIDVAHVATARLALDMNILNEAVFQDGDARFHRRHIDENLGAHAAILRTILRTIPRTIPSAQTPRPAMSAAAPGSAGVALISSPDSGGANRAARAPRRATAALW